VREAEDRASDTSRRVREAHARAEALAKKNAKLEEDIAALRGEIEALRSTSNGPASAPAESRRSREARDKLDAHFSPGDACLMVICEELRAARESADLCVFTITDDRISKAVLDAHRRGVRVRIITDNDKALDQGSDVHRLRRAGIAVREDDTPYHMHHKFAVFDGESMLTGSYNWTRGAAENNQENLVVSNDPRLVDPFTREFETLWRKFAENG
jgi:phosphatidylserine/phosphatidylglycerophosphate/cardiolipin synthase-like enzyme